MQVQEGLIERERLLGRIKELEAENAELRKRLDEDVMPIEKKPTAMQNLSLQEKVDLFRSLFKICIGVVGRTGEGKNRRRVESAEEEEVEYGEDKGWEHVDSLAVLNAEDGQAGGEEEETSDDRDLANHRFGDGGATIEEPGNGVDRALPTKEDEGAPDHANPIGGGEDGRRDEVESGIGEEKGIVSLDGAEDGADDRESPDTVEEAGGSQTVDETGSATSLGSALDTPSDIQSRPDEGPEGDTHDKEHGIGTLGEI